MLSLSQHDCEQQSCIQCNSAGAARLTITRGLPGSGKTTWAKAQASVWRVNRDGLRDMVTGSKNWNHGHGPDEDRLTLMHHAAVHALLADGAEVIVDDTNLAEEHVARWRELAARAGAAFCIQDFTYVPPETCIDRDAGRPEGERVGKQVITRMAVQHRLTQENPLAATLLPLPVE